MNYHAGNEHFRALVRKHKLEYVRCPKPQKGKFSRMIVDEIKNRTPPGRFLKQDGSTKLWYDIGEKKALDKTRQALREGAPEIMKELNGEGVVSDDEPLEGIGTGEVRGFFLVRVAAVNSASGGARTLRCSFKVMIANLFVGLLVVFRFILLTSTTTTRMDCTPLVAPLVWAEQDLPVRTQLGHMHLPVWLEVCCHRCSRPV